MATDGPNPLACSSKLYNASHVHTFAGLPTNAVECLVRSIANISGQPCDWHFFGGRAAVMASGDLEKVKQVIKDLRPLELYLLTRESLHINTNLSYQEW